jgi:hypothetical protein
MRITVLFFGDIVGRPGREALADALPALKEQYTPDLILANGENATHGRGLSAAHAKELLGLGIDCLTTGDHVWKCEDLYPLLDTPTVPVIRPANYPNSPGRGFYDLSVRGMTVRVVNLMGRVFMGEGCESPFTALDNILATTPRPSAVIVDFHAEATSEKRALAEHAAGRVALVVGTHTHVPTNDNQVLSSGTGFITDLGMCGPTDGILGVEKSEPLKHFLTGRPWRYSLASGACEVNGIAAVLNLATGHAESLTHIRISPL